MKYFSPQDQKIFGEKTCTRDLRPPTTSLRKFPPPHNHPKKRKGTPTTPLQYWVHLNRPNTATHNHGIDKKDPEIRNQLMYGCNAFWLTPTGSPVSSDKTKEAYMVKGGETSDSYFITETNTFSDDASVLLLTRGVGVDVILLKSLEEVFTGYTKKQVRAAWPQKKNKELLSSPEIRNIADRMLRCRGKGRVLALGAVTLEAFQAVVSTLREKSPMVGVVKSNIDLAKIKSLITTFENIFGMWAGRPGSNAHMYQTQRAAVIAELADYVRVGDTTRYDAAKKLLKYDKNSIDTAAFAMASAKGALPPSSSSSSSSSVASPDMELYKLKLNSLMGCMNAVAATLVKLDVSAPQKTVCELMLKSSAFMQIIGEENKPSLHDMLVCCGADDGGHNDNTRSIMKNRSADTWYGVLCLVHLCFQSKIDCSQIAGEANATGKDNGQSPYDRGKHIALVKKSTADGADHKVARTFQLKFDGVLRNKKYILHAWEKIFEELKVFADKDFWTDSKITETFGTLQISIEPQNEATLKAEKKKWTKRTDRNDRLEQLKWVFILYVESLQQGDEPTMMNFISTMMTPLGACFCSAYLAWLATGVYNLRRRVMAGETEKVPTWVSKKKVKEQETADITNTLHGEPFELFLRFYEAIVAKESPPATSILKTAQDKFNAKPLIYGNINKTRAALARAWYVVGVCRLNQRFSPRASIIDHIRVMDDKFWKSIQPDKIDGFELRRGLIFIKGSFGSIKLVLAQSKVCGARPKAQTAKYNKNKVEVQLYTPGAEFNSNYPTLAPITHRFLDAAAIISGDIKDRGYTIQVQNTDGMWKTHYATEVPSPANPVETKWFAEMCQEKGNRIEYPLLWANLKKDYAKGKEQLCPKHKKRWKWEDQDMSHEHNIVVRSLDIKMCKHPPRGQPFDHTLAKKVAATSTNNSLRLIFSGICSDLSRGNPITIANTIRGSKWNMQKVSPPTDGTSYTTGNVTKESVYIMEDDNTVANLTHDINGKEITAQDKKDFMVMARAVANGDLIIHPSQFGRQTNISHILGVLLTARHIAGWQQGDDSTDGVLMSRLDAQAKLEGHEGTKKKANDRNDSVLSKFYCKLFKTTLGNPEQYFEHFDRRVRAHPTAAVFSLEGIESFPSTLVECIPHNPAESPLVRALKDVRLLSIREQMQNLAVLSVYKSLLLFIIERQHEIPKHQECVLRWFGERANPPEMEQEVRESPRKKIKVI